MTQRLKKLPLIEYAMNSLMLLIGLCSTWYIFFDLFEIPFAGDILHLAGLCAVVFAGVFFVKKLFPSKQWSFLLLLLVFLIWLWAGKNMWNTDLEQGPIVFSRYIVPNLNRIVPYEFPDPPISTLAEKHSCANFLMFCLVPYTALFSYGILEMKSRVLTLALSIPVFAFAYALEGLPSTGMLLLIFLFWVVTLIKPKHHTDKFMLSHVTVAGSVAVSALLLTLLLAVFPPSGFKPHPKTGDVRNGLTDFAVRIESEGLLPALFGIASGSPLTSSNGNVNLNNSGSIRFTDKVILRVYSDKADNMYLRGYSAAVYDGNMWSQGDEGMLRGTSIPEDTMQFLGNGTDPIAYRDNEEYRIAVELMVENSNYTFTPYLMTLMDPKMDFIEDSHYQNSGMKSSIFMSHGSGNLGGYELETMEGYEGLVSDFYNKNESFGNLINLRAGLIYAPIENHGSEFPYYSDEERPYFPGYYDFKYPGEDSVILTMPADPEIERFDSLLDYTGQDAEYIRSIRDLYTQLPQGLDAELLTWWLGKRGVDPEDELFSLHMDALSQTPYWQWPTVAFDVASTVQSSGTYTKTPGRQPVNRDFVEYFLNERNQGYCVHYASATVTLLRAMGIPARYVEGYVVEGDKFNREMVANVPAENAHAWAEFWMPGMGWLPVESTPGGAAPPAYVPVNPEETVDADAEPVSTPEPEEAEPTTEPEESSEPQEEDNSQAPDTAEGQNQRSNTAQTYLTLLFIAIGIIAAVIIWQAARYISRILRRKRFSADNTNQAAIDIYSYMEWLSGMGCTIPENAQSLAMKARFSGHTMTAQELSTMQEYLKDCENQLGRSLPAAKRWLLVFLGVLDKNQGIRNSSQDGG